MVYVPGGTFQMGRNGGDEYEQPVHEVSVGPFYIDQYEVTCEQYEKFVSARNHAAPPGWINGKHPPGAERLPVTGVSWADANAYAIWAGKRLPSEAEWEFAARGTTNRIYPWGDEWKPNCANAGTTAAGKMVAVGSFADGKSPFGVLDMIGNAWEWTASKFVPYPGGRSATNASTDLIVIRGNFWQARANQATTTFRRGYPPVNEDYTNTGFRCVKDINRTDSHDAGQ
jgi:serine/threonine-protein kinase